MTDKNETPDRLILLGTESCHLCDEADIVVNEALQKFRHQFVIEKIDISEQEQWLERYAVRIPVIIHPESEQELRWPFNLNTLNQFLYGIQV